MPVDDELTTPILQNDGDDRNGDGGNNNVRRSNAFADDELDQLEGCAGSACCNPSSTCHRFIALILMCLVGFGEFTIECRVCSCLSVISLPFSLLLLL